jgi:hypothetical protein
VRCSIIDPQSVGQKKDSGLDTAMKESHVSRIGFFSIYYSSVDSRLLNFFSVLLVPVLPQCNSRVFAITACSPMLSF